MDTECHTYMHSVYSGIISLAAANISEVFQKMQEIFRICPGENCFSVANSKSLIYVLHITALL